MKDAILQWRATNQQAEETRDKKRANQKSFRHLKTITTAAMPDGWNWAFKKKAGFKEEQQQRKKEWIFFLPTFVQ